MVDSFSDIDPLDTSNLDQGDVDDLYKSQVRGIVKSYIDQFDVFSEIIQNSLDAVESKVKEWQKKSITSHLMMSIVE